ncbi:3-deoxy-manno-octulosonate cytidylyltransferase [Gammaproteobacteria bacterium]|nr:3-deoxy-manno-octulosonate cytidylyltransferase [Gammaproteobacteria bacterium]
MNSSNKTIILIPARIASTRLPNKPLLKIDGKEMILKVWESAQMSNADLVMVATDSAEIADILRKNNAKYFITKNEHASGTDRIHEVLTTIDPDKHYEYVVNLQGDLPNVKSSIIDRGLEQIKDTDADILTYARIIDDKKDILNPNIVKIATSASQKNDLQAIYFSRSPIPYGGKVYYEHIGIYIYKREALDRFISMKPSSLEKEEKLEQLRAIQNSMKINLILVDDKIISIDTLDDVERFKNAIKD